MSQISITLREVIRSFKVARQFSIKSNKEEIIEKIEESSLLTVRTINGITVIKGPIKFLLKHRESGLYLCIKDGELKLAMLSEHNRSKFLLHAYTFTGIDDEQKSSHWQRPVNIIMMYVQDNLFLQAKEKTTSLYTAEVITKKGKPLKKGTTEIEGEDPRFFMVHFTSDNAISLESFLSKQYFLASEYNGKEGDPRPQLYYLPCDSHMNFNNYGTKFDLIPQNDIAEEYAQNLKEQYSEYLRWKGR